MWYFYYQTTPESSWELAQSKLRQNIVEAVEPPFTTILDLDADIQDEMVREDLDKVHYKGPLYFDFDSDSIEEVIPRFQKFLSKLTEIEIDLRQVRLYASGGKGFHVVIPMEVFVEKPSTAGYTFLPQIYKEIAYKLYVDTLDMRVYSARKGRMFRTENVLRPNGKYKVQLSVVEAQGITTEDYDELTSKPGDGWQISKPVFNNKLGLLFVQARDAVKTAIEKRRSSKADEKLIAQFDGQFPSSVQMLGSGNGVREGAGFQKIATQLAIMANALGQSEEQLLAICAGLIENHQSDGTRYNSPQKRRKELLRMYHYMQDNPCYEFSAGGIKSCLDPTIPTPDLTIPIEDAHGALDEDEDLDIDDSVTKGIRFNKDGIFLKVYDKETKEWKVLRSSHLGMDGVAILRNLNSSETMGYEVDIYVEGKHQGRRALTANTFTSSMELRKVLGGAHSVAIQINEAQTNALFDLLRKKAEVSNNIVINVPREGIDVVPLSDTETETQRVDVIYAGPSKYGVLMRDGAEGGTKYRLQSPNGQDGEFKSDLLAAPAFSETLETETEFFDRFFGLFETRVMARSLGYFLSCFLAQPVRFKFSQFPMLQLYGDAGAGKTSMAQLLGNMHFYNKQPTVWSAGDMTPFALSSLLQSSGSIPVIFDELKKRELGFKKAQDFMMIMRNNYTGNTGGKGRVNKDAGQSTLSISQSASVAPLVFLGEELEGQTAILDRSIVVAMNKRQETDPNGDWAHSHRNRRILGTWGHLCVRKLLDLNLDEMSNTLDDYIQLVSENARNSPGARPIFNNAVLLLGLDLGKLTLASEFGDRYDQIFDDFKREIVENFDQVVVRNQSEASKCLTSIAALSARPSTDPFRLILGEDYMPSIDGATKEPCVDIHLRNAWDKYSRHKRSQGDEVLYHSEASFINAMTRHRAVADSVCAGSELKGGRPSVKVVRFKLRDLYNEEGVEEFKDLEKSKFKL